MSSRSTLPDPLFQQRCQHVYADGRRCMALRLDRHCTLCFQHWTRQRDKEDSLWAADDIFSYVKDLKTKEEINEVLARIFRHVIYNRIPQRKAGLLAYICQLLIITLPRSENGLKSGPENSPANGLENITTSEQTAPDRVTHDQMTHDPLMTGAATQQDASPPEISAAAQEVSAGPDSSPGPK